MNTARGVSSIAMTMKFAVVVKQCLMSLSLAGLGNRIKGAEVSAMVVIFSFLPFLATVANDHLPNE